MSKNRDLIYDMTDSPETEDFEQLDSEPLQLGGVGEDAPAADDRQVTTPGDVHVAPQMPTPVDGTLRQFALRVPDVIDACSGIMVFGKRIKSLVFSTDLSIIRNVNADAVFAVYPFTPQPLFAGDLFRMYTKYCEMKGWKIAISSFTEGAAGGFKEIIFSVTGEKVYGTLKYESGVHRVQRVPATETQGRVHTSAATVAVLPEAQEFDVEINEGEIKWDTFRSSGAGGQNVNKVESGVRARYLWKNPNTGETEEILIECTETRDQPKNKERALARLRTFIYDKEHQKYIDDIANRRKTMVSTGDRSAKIRTYNYPQSRITDHRIGYNMQNLPSFMDGNIQDCIDQLTVAENAERMKESEL